jgi:tetratricopeptide (TPR) repeat protein
MKKIYLLAMFGVALGFSACNDKLDIAQKASLTTATFYQTDDDFAHALGSAYEQFQCNTMGRAMGPGIYTPARVMANHPGDDVNYGGAMYGDHEFGGSVDEFRYRHTPEAIDYHYQGLYLSIFPDNLVIEKFEAVQNPTQFMKQCVAEARVLRAYNYFLLACYWGQPPHITKSISMSDTPSNSEMTQQQYFQWVAQECEAAVPDLLERQSTADKEGAYRITKGFAWAMAGKAYMFAGDFAKAKENLKKVIDSGKYDLVSGDEFANLFHIEGDGCPEKVFEVNVRYNPGAGEWSTGSGLGWNQHSTWMEPQCFQIRSGYFKKNPLLKYTGGVEGWGSIGLPEWYSAAFVENDGRDSKRLQATMVTIDDLIYQESGNELLDYNDKLKKMTHDEKVKSANYGIAELGGHYGQSFWIPIKHIIRAADAAEGENKYGNVHRLNNIIIMRYAEVLLNYAECCIRTGAAAEAGDYIRKIQERAGSKTVLSGTPTIVDLMKEKSFELWFEGCRYQDLLRWKKTDGDQAYVKECFEHLKAQGTHIPHLADKLFRNTADYPGDVDRVWEFSKDGSDKEDRFYLFHTHEAMDAGYEVGWKEKHALFPYPQSVIDMNPNITQNPGW